nr:MAG TPA_asm: hypothetical protein [Caudoviricetes sp.]
MTIITSPDKNISLVVGAFLFLLYERMMECQSLTTSKVSPQ